MKSPARCAAAAPAAPALHSCVAEVFADGGALSQALPGFQPRSGQTAMALAVAETITDGGALVVEAGTGVGKTFAYLVPALLSGEKVLLCTATKTLQDQLFGRDLPLLVAALGRPVRAALLKGRSSYLCLQRLGQARLDASVDADDLADLAVLARIELWAQATDSGDLAEVPALDGRSPWWPRVSSTRENCLGADCPQLRACHVNAARKDALAADVVVLNHHLFFADLALRESGVAALLPAVRVVVLDEAHQLNAIGVQFLGTQLSTGQLLDFARDLLATGLHWARGLADWPLVAAQLTQAARDLRLLLGPALPGAVLRWRVASTDGADSADSPNSDDAGGLAASPEGVAANEWCAALEAVQQACAQAQQMLAVVSDIAPDLVRLATRADSLLERLAFFAGPDAHSVRWLELGTQLRLLAAPLDIAQEMQRRLFPSDLSAVVAGQVGHVGQVSSAQGVLATPKAWIFTSATLGTDARLREFTGPCGLDQARVERVSSPFDYAAQAAFYVPMQLPKPADPQHSVQLAALVAQAAQRLGGRTLVLTTSLRALRLIAQCLRQHFEDSAAMEVLEQGQSPPHALLARFRAANGAGAAGCILVASVSFWEGVDVPGAALQLLVIDKLPFPSPSDPLVEARSQRVQQAGRSAFAAHALPAAALALKQGAGRLIRSESDHGVLLLGDTRLLSMPYGKRLLAALPPMRALHCEADFDAALDALVALNQLRETGAGA